MRIVGASTTSAPTSSSARTSSPACSRARVTTMRRPRKGGTERFPDNPDAWMLLGEAYQMVFRQKDALHAYEQALALEERPDAAVAAGDLYRRAGLLQEAAARFARAYAAGGGAEALWLNAQALFQAGEERAADEALHLWATQVPGGLDRMSDARAELRGGKREGK